MAYLGGRIRWHLMATTTHICCTYTTNFTVSFSFPSEEIVKYTLICLSRKFSSINESTSNDYAYKRPGIGNSTGKLEKAYCLIISALLSLLTFCAITPYYTGSRLASTSSSAGWQAALIATEQLHTKGILVGHSNLPITRLLTSITLVSIW